MTAMPEVVTHRYDPARGMCGNLCALEDSEAERILDRLRRESRPGLKPSYLTRRRITEQWLSQAASSAFQRNIANPPIYFFLGDFSHLSDLSRPASLLVPLASLPADAITFTLGDSMSVAAEPGPRLYRLEEMIEVFTDGEAVSGIGFSDKFGFQSRFIEVQLWARFRGLEGFSRPD
ncbi:MAG TPA: hypothetical protein VMB18_11730 [Terriglobales bacterium]|nr:hypothetical protein [Terriglobales bacterium]